MEIITTTFAVIPLWSYILLGGLFIIILALALLRTLPALMYALIGLLLGASFFQFYQGYTQATSSAPGGIAQLETEISLMKNDINAVKAERDIAINKLVQLTGEQNPIEAVTKVKSDYKNLFINYFYLEKCGSGNVYEASAIITMLSLELSKLGAAANDSWNVVSDARIDFQRDFGASLCDPAMVTKISGNQKQYSEAALKNLQAEFSLTPPEAQFNFMLNSLATPPATPPAATITAPTTPPAAETTAPVVVAPQETTPTQPAPNTAN